MSGEGGRRLRALVAERRPDVVAVAGITAYRAAFDERSARAGEQPGRWDGSRVFVVPNPSGLNAHETVETLAAAYADAARAAGVVAGPGHRMAATVRPVRVPTQGAGLGTGQRQPRQAADHLRRRGSEVPALRVAHRRNPAQVRLLRHPAERRGLGGQPRLQEDRTDGVR